MCLNKYVIHFNFKMTLNIFSNEFLPMLLIFNFFSLYIHVYTPTYIYICTHKHIYIYIYICMYIDVCEIRDNPSN